MFPAEKIPIVRVVSVKTHFSTVVFDNVACWVVSFAAIVYSDIKLWHLVLNITIMLYDAHEYEIVIISKCT